MKVSLNWVKEYTDVKLSVDDLVTKIGAQLGAVEEVIDIGKKYGGIVVARVVTCQKHPNADKLHVCMIDDGGVVRGVARISRNQVVRATAVLSSERVAEGDVREGTLTEQRSEEGGNAQKSGGVGGFATKQAGRSHGLVQVVCGAPNVSAGMLVVWIPPGATVPSSVDRDSFVLDAREIRGIVSNGMLASPHELAISDDHTGILEIDNTKEQRAESIGRSNKIRPGMAFKDLFGLDDTIIDIENKMFTHRPDLFGQLGVAREIAGICHNQFNSPKWYTNNPQPTVNSKQTKKLEMKVENLVPKLCPRYMAIALDNVKIGPSPVWLQACLSRVGIRPINNIVDITNYLMMLTAQPLHAFDYDKVAQNGKAKIVVRSPKKGEKMTLLDGKEIQPRAEAILICNQDKPIALGGVMGGNNSEIDEKTTSIIIESANFDMYNIRKTAMEHGVFTDAVTRFNKGQSPAQCAPVLLKAVQMVQALCPESIIASQTSDIYKKPATTRPITITADFINDRLGTKLSLKDIASLLEKVEFQVLSAPAERKRLHILPPFWRQDIEIAEDVVEEVGRLYGYDHLPLKLPNRSIKAAPENPIVIFKNKLRELLAKAGANEILTYSFVHGNLIDNARQDRKNAFQLSNALSPDLQYYRLSLLPSLLDKIHQNIKAGYDEFALFELSSVHAKDYIGTKDALPIEDLHLALIITAGDKLASDKYSGAPYFEVKKYLTTILDNLGVTASYEPLGNFAPENGIEKALLAPFEKQRLAVVKSKEGQFIGAIGELSSKTSQKLKLPKFCAGFEVNVKKLLELQSSHSRYTAMPRFPKVEQDISIKVKADMAYGELYNFIHEEITNNVPENCWWTLSDVDIYQREDDIEHKQITLRLTIASHQRTLTAEEVNALLDTVAETAKEKHGAERI